VVTLTALVVGDTIGAGVYTTSGYALADLGSRWLVMLAWAIGGLVALAGAASYAMLARRMTESGGEYLYLSQEMHPAAGSVAGYVSLLAGFTGAIALAAIAAEGYARAAFPAIRGLPPGVLAAGAVLAAGLIHVIRAEAGAAVHDLLVAAKLAALIGFCLFAGWVILARGAAAGAEPAATAPGLAGFAGTLVWVSLSFSGFNAAVYVAGEARDPARSVPRALMGGTACVAVLYLLLNAVFLFAAPPLSVAGQAEVAGVAAGALGGPALRRAVEALIALSLVTAITSMVLAAPRLYARMAADGVLPAFLRTRGDEPPRAAILLQVGLAMLVAAASGLRDLLGYLGFTLSLSAALAVTTLFWRHRRTGERPDGRLYPLAPALFVSVTLTTGLLAALRQPGQFAAAVATLLVGMGAWWVRTTKR